MDSETMTLELTLILTNSTQTLAPTSRTHLEGSQTLSLDFLLVQAK